MDPDMIAGLVVLLVSGVIVGVVSRKQEKRHDQDMALAQKRYDADMAKAAADLAAARADIAAAQAAGRADATAAQEERDKERTERERWWKAYTEEATAHLQTRTEMQDSLDSMESKLRDLTIKSDEQARTIAELNTKADEQHKTIAELNDTVARLTAQLQGEDQ